MVDLGSAAHFLIELSHRPFGPALAREAADAAWFSLVGPAKPDPTRTEGGRQEPPPSGTPHPRRTSEVDQ